MTTDPAADRIRAFAAEAVSPERLPPGATRLLAVGWATVELERAIGELATDFVEAPPSAVLGAHAVAAAFLLADGSEIFLAVLEPSTEGRLAAALARWDEGPVVAWYAGPAVAPPGRTLPGPFGPERLVPGDALTGPHRLLLATGSTDHSPGASTDR